MGLISFLFFSAKTAFKVTGFGTLAPLKTEGQLGIC